MKFRNTQVWGFEHAMRGMRNAFNSWKKNDTLVADCDYCFSTNHIDCDHCYPTYPTCRKTPCFSCGECQSGSSRVHIGKNDMDLAHRLMNSKFECDAKFLRMIHVSVDIDMPRYWWAECDTYHFNVKNSCSTMHTIMKRDVTINDFQVDDIIKEILTKKEKIKKKFIYKCILPVDSSKEFKTFTIGDYEYEISNDGEVYSMPRDVPDSLGRVRHHDKQLLTIGQNYGEYFSVRLGSKSNSVNVPIHKLIAQMFIPNPNNLPEVNHIDGDKGNCSISNLEWCTASENNKHAFDTGLKQVSLYAKYRAYINNRKVTLTDIRLMQEMYKTGITQKEIASKFDIKQAQVSAVLNGNICENADIFEEAYVYETVINRLNELRQMYMDTKDYGYIIRMKRILPESFLQMRTFDTNYSELRNMYFQRQHHRLKEEWQDTFCKWVETLPYSAELITYDTTTEEEV